MTFDTNLLKTYRELLQTTALIDGYQEFIKLFRSIRSELKNSMPEYQFQGSITENGMDYTYFSFTDQTLKEKGIKIVVVFLHKEFRFEVWASGFNRKSQLQYHERLKNQALPFDLADDPLREDYILRVVLRDFLEGGSGDRLLEEIRSASNRLIDFVRCAI